MGPMPGMQMGTRGFSAAGGPQGAAHLAGASTASILPVWLAVAWVLALLLVAGVHCRHLLCTRGQRRAWHCVHVTMALGMALMYAPASLAGPDDDPWRNAFAAAAAAVLAWTVTRMATRRGTSALWLLAGADLAAMAYMWAAPVGGLTRLSWVLVAYFGLEAVLWISNSCRQLREHLLPTGTTLLPVEIRTDTTVQSTPAASIRERLQLRVSLAMMALGMAYMLLAMALAH